MARRTVEEIRDDFTGETFYASNDGFTSEPLSVIIDGTEHVKDAAPSTKQAISEFFNGNTDLLRDLLNKMAKPSRPTVTVDVAKRTRVAEWYATAKNDGKVPGRVTVQMVDAYDLHLRAEEIKANADKANADAAETPESTDSAENTPETPESTSPARSRRNA